MFFVFDSSMNQAAERETTDRFGLNLNPDGADLLVGRCRRC